MSAKNRPDKLSIQGILSTAKHVSATITPLEPISERALEFFNRVIESREASSWVPHDLSLASLLAKTMVRYEEVENIMQNDGLMVVCKKKGALPHPLMASSATLINNIQTLSKTLGISASQRGLSGVDQAGRNKADREARQVMKKASETSLLA